MLDKNIAVIFHESLPKALSNPCELTMHYNGLPIYLSALEQAIDHHPLTIAPDTPVSDVLNLMSQVRSSCDLPSWYQFCQLDPLPDASAFSEARSSCVLVMERSKILGVFTERDIVRLTASGVHLTDVKVSEVMTQSVVTLKLSDSPDIFTALSLLRQHRIRHLPIVDDRDRLVGMVTPEGIRQALQPVNLLTSLRYVADVMTHPVVHAPTTTTVLELAQLMAEHRVSCVVLVESGKRCQVPSTNSCLVPALSPTAKFSCPLSEDEPSYSSSSTPETLVPVGIVTERDIVQFHALELDLTQIQATDVMSSPLFCLAPTDSLWVAHQEMQRRRVRRLVVAGPCGELLGIVSQSSLLRVLNPSEMYGLIELLQQAVDDRTTELKQANEHLQREILERQRAEEALRRAHDDLKQQVEERTAELSQSNELLRRDIIKRQRVEEALRRKEARVRTQARQLEQALRKLQQTQAQLIQTEKMSSLGQMIAGIAHEINNPVNFIYGNLSHASHYIEEMMHLLRLYQQAYPHPVPEIETAALEIDLDFITEDLEKILSSMQIGAERIRQIVLSLRNFSRLDEADMKLVDIHEGIESTLLILQHRLKPHHRQPAIQIVKEYGELPRVECYAGQLNQVFMNILSNAIDALEEEIENGKWLNIPENLELFGAGHNSSAALTAAEVSFPMPVLTEQLPTITIRTEVVSDGSVAIRISDNGPGIRKEIRKQLFDPFFTTKPIGKGTGLGLSIAHHLVVEKHGGHLDCTSEPGWGTEFSIEIPLRLRQQRSA